ncbi:hypothetical protein CONPUDRAFT_155818 [Coniophora puteana RWD-64-598 SS2]|uniref:Uncharacterized protein n=1 Tax=Coniophora puteana (strain RWD-64-598) TaxID=741705 RepID=A0A5M3MIR4_CONPW|nr:uncharacterized protein CONPUDRAFT_155818 [Coniophora puteana RWD-64-598 SS2]EIW79138.1 hypothetical protein CONPUDRAFT_155818 [Coniophora puteana RWD-64-598 SS2]
MFEPNLPPASPRVEPIAPLRHSTVVDHSPIIISPQYHPGISEARFKHYHQLADLIHTGDWDPYTHHVKQHYLDYILHSTRLPITRRRQPRSPAAPQPHASAAPAPALAAANTAPAAAQSATVNAAPVPTTAPAAAHHVVEQPATYPGAPNRFQPSYFPSQYHSATPFYLPSNQPYQQASGFYGSYPCGPYGNYSATNSVNFGGQHGGYRGGHRNRYNNPGLVRELRQQASRTEQIILTDAEAKANANLARHPGGNRGHFHNGRHNARRGCGAPFNNHCFHPHRDVDRPHFRADVDAASRMECDILRGIVSNLICECGSIANTLAAASVVLAGNNVLLPIHSSMPSLQSVSNLSIFSADFHGTAGPSATPKMRT